MEITDAKVELIANISYISSIPFIRVHVDFDPEDGNRRDLCSVGFQLNIGTGDFHENILAQVGSYPRIFDALLKLRIMLF
jgi:hypothetical protein